MGCTLALVVLLRVCGERMCVCRSTSRHSSTAHRDSSEHHHKRRAPSSPITQRSVAICLPHSMCRCLAVFVYCLHFTWVVDDAKRIVIMRVCLSAAACLHYCTDPGVTWGVVEDAPYLCSIGRICNQCTGCIAMTTQRKPYLQACVCPMIWRHSAKAKC